MHLVSLSLSPKQRSRLRNGHKVRVKRGAGFNVVVSPENYDILTRSFARNKGTDIKLSPDEIMANKSISPEAHQSLVEQSGDELTQMNGEGLHKTFKNIGKAMWRGLKHAGKKAHEAATSDEAKAYANEYLKPIAKEVAHDQVAKVHQRAADEMTQRGYDRQSHLNALNKLADMSHEKIAGMGLYAGAYGGSLVDIHNATVANMLQNRPLRGRIAKRIKHSFDDLDAPLSRGNGLNLAKVGKKIASNAVKPFTYGYNLGYTKIGPAIAGKGLLTHSPHHVPQALKSQPYMENLQFKYTLPPEYSEVHEHNHIVGNGLFA